MGQSQSDVERHKTLPISPDKVFGFIYFERRYNNWIDYVKAENKKIGALAQDEYVEKRNAESAKAEYFETWGKDLKKAVNLDPIQNTEELLKNHFHLQCFGGDEGNQSFQAAWKGMDKTLSDLFKPDQEQPKLLKLKNTFLALYKDKYERILKADSTKWKDKIAAKEKIKPNPKNDPEISKQNEKAKEWIAKHEPKQGMADLHATKYDAESMYDFLANTICKDIQDITIMTPELDFYRLFKKPVYEGDYLTQMFDWNLNSEFINKDKKEIIEHVIAKPTKEEDWEDFKLGLEAIKYKITNENHKLKRDETQKRVEAFKEYVADEDELKSKSLDELLKFKIKCEDFWLRGSEDERRETLFRKMHPLIFLKEEQPAYVKIQNNWVFQFLSTYEKKDYLQTRIPKYVEPEKGNYEKHFDEIKKYTEDHPNKQVLSIQTFACHGIVSNGVQKCLLNKPNKENNFYETLDVEQMIRQRAPKMPKVFFLVMFACCRESHNSAKDAQQFGIAARDLDEDPKEVSSSIANFTMAFGCDPANGVPADTQLVMTIVNHLRSYFSPEDGHAMIPDCFNAIDAVSSKVALEQTSCNLGKNLRLLRQDNRIGIKQLIVIIRNPPKPQPQNKDSAATKEETKEKGKVPEVPDSTYPKAYIERMLPRTEELLKFFKKNLKFEDEEIIYLTEDEVRTLVDLFDQSKIFKTYNKKIEPRLRQLAKHVFLGKANNQAKQKRFSSCNQLLTVFLNESRDESVKDFIVNRSPEFALTIKPGPSKKEGQRSEEVEDEPLRRYINDMVEYFKTLNQIHFENINRFFVSDSTIAQFCARNKTFKPGSGHFDLIFDLEEKKDQTMMARFNYLEKCPLKKLSVGKFSLAVPLATGSDEILMIEIIDNNDKMNQEEIEAQLPFERVKPKTSDQEKEKKDQGAKVEDERRFKRVRAFKVNPNIDDPTENMLAQSSAVQHMVKIELGGKLAWFLNERDEIVHIKQLYYNPESTEPTSPGKPDRIYCEVLFAIVLRNQDKLNLCHVRYYSDCEKAIGECIDARLKKIEEEQNEEPTKTKEQLTIANQTGDEAEITKAKNEFVDGYKKWNEGKEKSKNHFLAEMEKLQGNAVKINFLYQDIIKKPQPNDEVNWKTRAQEEKEKKEQEEEAKKKQTDDQQKEPKQDSDEKFADEDKFVRKQRTDLQYFYADQFKAYSDRKRYHQKQLVAFNEWFGTALDNAMTKKIKQELHQKKQSSVLNKQETEEEKLKRKFKIKFNCNHLRFFASPGKDEIDKNKVFIYILTNRQRLNNMQSCMEIEVITFDRTIARTDKPDKALTALKTKHERQYLPYFIRDAKGQESTGENRHFYEMPEKKKDDLKDKNQDFKNQYYLQQFFTKMPTCFRQSSCDGDRLIFRAGSRSTWVYDLKMENGYLRLFSKDDIDNKKSVGLQESGMVKDLDFVTEDMINIVTEQYEGMWMEKTTIDSEEINDEKFRIKRNMKETLMTKLPKILKFPAGFMKKSILLAISKQQIALVNTKSEDKKKEFLIVQQRALSEHDCIAHAFITHEHEKLEMIDKKEVRKKCKNAQDCEENFENLQGLHSLKLHYFERFFDAQHRLKACTYNTFDMTSDFLNMIEECGLVIPSEKTLLTREIKNFKSKPKKVKVTEEGDKDDIEKKVEELMEKVEKELKATKEWEALEAIRKKQEKLMEDIQKTQQDLAKKFDEKMKTIKKDLEDADRMFDELQNMKI